MAEAAELEALYQEYKDRGFIVVTMLAENNSGSAPTMEDLQAWQATYSVTHPLVSDGGWAASYDYVTVGIPSQQLLKPGAELVVVDGFGLTGADIEPYLPESGSVSVEE